MRSHQRLSHSASMPTTTSPAWETIRNMRARNLALGSPGCGHIFDEVTTTPRRKVGSETKQSPGTPVNVNISLNDASFVSPKNVGPSSPEKVHKSPGSSASVSPGRSVMSTATTAQYADFEKARTRMLRSPGPIYDIPSTFAAATKPKPLGRSPSFGGDDRRRYLGNSSENASSARSPASPGPGRYFSKDYSDFTREKKAVTRLDEARSGSSTAQAKGSNSPSFSFGKGKRAVFSPAKDAVNSPLAYIKHSNPTAGAGGAYLSREDRSKYLGHSSDAATDTPSPTSYQRIDKMVDQKVLSSPSETDDPEMRARKQDKGFGVAPRQTSVWLLMPQDDKASETVQYSY
jgi:hypothetical protein